MQSDVWPKKKPVGRIRADLWSALRALPRASKHTYPCAAEIVDGASWPCVLFIQKADYHQWYEGCRGTKRDPFLDVGRVARVFPSPHKTPKGIEKKMYRVGETRMGGFVVQFRLSDGTSFVHTSGDFCEFVTVPQGYISDDITGVVFEDGRGGRLDLGRVRSLVSPDWKWCLFEPP